ncbi:hypothetical protein [Subtercola vilae]|uniref:Uncharacterized protein n=1 Tax=Subtercola vilae TaxID=2056433 RepID=A0A4T2B883_9MICO|nr:hypothetical protein [Subtercola vilae]TIH27047.1 hypothetical protein D4765_18755 [Subtercola vilae]
MTLPTEINTVIASIWPADRTVIIMYVLLADGWHVFTPKYYLKVTDTARQLREYLSAAAGFRVLYPVPEEI